MIDQAIIDKLNWFVKESKTRELTPEETEHRKSLRQEYLKQFRSGFEQRIQNIKVVKK